MIPQKEHHQRRRFRQRRFWHWLFTAIVGLARLAAFLYRLFGRD